MAITNPASTDLAADVVVVGGGAVGSLVASLLHGAGAKTLLLEAGPRAPRDEPDDAWRYRSDPQGALWLRARALGGRTHVWGGWCFRACEQNVVDAERAGAPWSIPLRSLDPYYARVERHLGVVGNRDGLSVVPDGECLGPVALHPRLSALSEALDLPVIAGRIARVDGRPWRGTDVLKAIDVRTDAPALRVVTRDGLVVGVEYHTADGPRFVRAPRVVLAASAIETARLLCEHGGDDELAVTSSLVASYLVVHDGRVDAAPGASNAALVPRFVNVAGGEARPYVGGFSVEIQGPGDASVLGPHAAAMLDLADQSLDDKTLYLVSALGTMLPSRERTVRFDREDRDALGRPVPVLRLAPTDNDRAIGEEMKATCLAICEALGGADPLVVPLASPDGLTLGAESLRRHDARDRDDLDADGRWQRASGLYVADARHMPLVSDRHPTLTLLACAARTVDAVLRDALAG